MMVVSQPERLVDRDSGVAAGGEPADTRWRAPMQARCSGNDRLAAAFSSQLARNTSVRASNTALSLPEKSGTVITSNGRSATVVCWGGGTGRPRGVKLEGRVRGGTLPPGSVEGNRGLPGWSHSPRQLISPPATEFWYLSPFALLPLLRPRGP